MRIRALARPAVDIAVPAAILIAVYSVAPVQQRVNGGWIVRLVVGVLGTAAFIAWEVRAIAGAPRPAARAARGLVTGVLFFVMAFALTYTAMSSNDSRAFSEPLDRIGALYFAMATFATVGYGDIVPVTHAARIAVTIQISVDLIVVAVAARTLFRAAADARAQRKIN